MDNRKSIRARPIPSVTQSGTRLGARDRRQFLPMRILDTADRQNEMPQNLLNLLHTNNDLLATDPALRCARLPANRVSLLLPVNGAVSMGRRNSSSKSTCRGLNS